MVSGLKKVRVTRVFGFGQTRVANPTHLQAKVSSMDGQEIRFIALQEIKETCFVGGDNWLKQSQ